MTGFPISLDQPARFSGALPKACDVAVIGGGIIGVMTAWYLTRAGKKVILCEKGRVGAEQSSRNWGWIRQQGRDLDELPIMVESLALWRELAAELGPGLGFCQGGAVYMANSAKDMTEFENWMPHARAHGLDTRLLSRGEMAELLGAEAWPGGMITPSDARAEPWVAVPMIAAALAEKAARLLRIARCAGWT